VTVWRALEGVEDYQRWWPWLRRFDAGPLVTGEHWTCAARPPVPYVVRFHLALDDVVAPDHVDATVSGDIAGRALLTLTERAGACELRLQAVLAPARSLLQAVTALLPPVARFGHDRLITTGAAQFGAVALGSRAALPS
jgi:hypothetical protein